MELHGDSTSFHPQDQPARDELEKFLQLTLFGTGSRYKRVELGGARLFLFFRQIFQNIGKYDDTSGYFTIKLPRKVLPSAGGLKKHAGPPIAHPYSVYVVGSDYVQY